MAGNLVGDAIDDIEKSKQKRKKKTKNQKEKSKNKETTDVNQNCMMKTNMCQMTLKPYLLPTAKLNQRNILESKKQNIRNIQRGNRIWSKK